jgi:hypothetical protein
METKRTEADEHLLEEANKYFDPEEIHAIKENAVRNWMRKVLAPQLRARFELEVDDRCGENGDRLE